MTKGTRRCLQPNTDTQGGRLQYVVLAMPRHTPHEIASILVTNELGATTPSIGSKQSPEATTTGHRCQAQTKEQLQLPILILCLAPGFCLTSETIKSTKKGVRLMSSLPSHHPDVAALTSCCKCLPSPAYRAPRSKSINRSRCCCRDEL